MSLKLCICGHPQAEHWHNRGIKPPFEVVPDTVCHAVLEANFPLCTCGKFVEDLGWSNNHNHVQRAIAGED